MGKDELSDEFLIDSIAGGAIWALERLYQRYRGRFYVLAYRMTADHMVAEELVQDAFHAIWQSARSYVPQAGPVRSWLFSIIYHCAVDYVRSVRRRSILQQVTLQQVEAEECLASSGMWEQVERSVLSAELHTCLAQLPAEQQAAISLAYFEGWTHQEIAQRSQVSLGTVKTRIRLGILHLRHILAQGAEDEKISSGSTNRGEARPGPAASVVVQAEERGCATGYQLCQNESCRCFGYTEWELLLEEIKAFKFRGDAGSFIARKEGRPHGCTYWYAYTWGSAGRQKAYLGKATTLTLARMEAMARQLHEGD